MTDLINLAPEGRSPLLVEPHAVSCVVESLAGRWTEIFIHGARDSLVLYGDNYRSAESCAAQLDAAGATFGFFPVRRGAENTLHLAAYFDFNSFRYFDMLPYYRAGRMNVTLSGAGFGRSGEAGLGHRDELNSAWMTAEELRTLTEFLKAKNPTIFMLGEPMGMSGVVMLDPKKIRNLSIDQFDKNEQKVRVNFGLNSQAILDFSGGPLSFFPKDLPKQDRNVEQGVDDWRETACNACIQQLAAAAPHLLELKGASPAEFIDANKVAEIQWLNNHKRPGMNIYYDTILGEEDGYDGTTVHFNSSALAQQAYDQFLSLGARPHQMERQPSRIDRTPRP